MNPRPRAGQAPPCRRQVVGALMGSAVAERRRRRSSRPASSGINGSPVEFVENGPGVRTVFVRAARLRCLDATQQRSRQSRHRPYRDKGCWSRVRCRPRPGRRGAQTAGSCMRLPGRCGLPSEGENQAPLLDTKTVNHVSAHQLIFCAPEGTRHRTLRIGSQLPHRDYSRRPPPT